MEQSVSVGLLKYDRSVLEGCGIYCCFDKLGGCLSLSLLRSGTKFIKRVTTS